MDQVTTVGIDLAKQVISVHGIDGSGKVVLRRTMRREKLAELIAQLPKCLIGMEACSGAHEWARQFQALGHEVRLMAPKFVIPYRKSGKNDGNDAEAICEAVGRPNMRFVPVKSVEQQAALTLHRVRQGFVEERTATINRIRGLIAEFGIVLPQRAASMISTANSGRQRNRQYSWNVPALRPPCSIGAPHSIDSSRRRCRSWLRSRSSGLRRSRS